MAFGRRALRGTTSQLRSHALRPAERGRRTSAPVEEHSGGLGGQALCGPSRGGDGPRRPTRAPGASRGSRAWGLVRVDVFTARRPLLRHHFIFNGIRSHLSSSIFSWERPHGCIIPWLCGSVPTTCIRFAYALYLPCWGRPSGCIIPKLLGPDPVAFAFSAFI